MKSQPRPTAAYGSLFEGGSQPSTHVGWGPHVCIPGVGPTAGTQLKLVFAQEHDIRRRLSAV